MSTVINTNLASVYARSNLSSAQNALSTSVERLSSGLRINRAKDDAAGLGISETIKSQLTSLNQSSKNANDAVSMLQTAEGSLSEVSDILLRMKELATQGMNESLSTTQKKSLSDELVQLKNEVNAIAERTTYNSQTLLKAGLISEVTSTSAVKQGTVLFTSKLSVDQLTVADSTNVGSYDVVFGTGTTLKSTLTSTVNTRSESSTSYGRTITLTEADTTKGNRVVLKIDGREYAAQVVQTATDTDVARLAGVAASLRSAISAATGINGNTLYTVAAGTDGVISITSGAGTANISLEVYSADTSKVSIFAQSSTGLSSVSQSLDIGSIAVGATREYQFDRLGITLAAKNLHTAAITAAPTMTAVADNQQATVLTLQAASTTAQFQVGAGTTRDVMSLDGFKDVRISEFNKNTTTSEALVFKRVSEVLRNISVNSSASLSSDNFEILQNNLGDAIETVSEFRATLGSQQNRLEYTVGNLQSQMDNLSAANSRIRDTDFAAETANLTKTQIMQQAATAMLAQANQMPNVILALLK